MFRRLSAAALTLALCTGAQAAPLTYALDVDHGGLSGPGAAGPR